MTGDSAQFIGHTTSEVEAIAQGAVPKAIVDFYPRRLVLEELNVSEATLRRDIQLLREKCSADFDYCPYDLGFSEKSFKVLKRYRQLVPLMGREKAARTIAIKGI